MFLDSSLSIRPLLYMSSPLEKPDRTRIESIFIRHRNVLMVRGNFTDIFTDHYLHLADQDLRYRPEIDHRLKELYVAITLHAVARPWAETHAWTANIRAPRVNFFATASSINENVTGRVFTENVKEPAQSALYAQVLDDPARGPSQSTVALEDDEPFHWVEHYYKQSEQRPARVFELEDENFVLLAAQPDFDEEWFLSLDKAAVAAIPETEETSPLEQRFFRFHCGCNLQRILPALAVWSDKMDELFQDDSFVTVQCPRCAASYQITREELEKAFSEQG